jgi:hypothetical protein
VSIAAVGKSTLHRARHAGRDATRDALAALGSQAHLLLVFATAGYDQEELIAGVRELSGDAAISGCSGEGVITQQGLDEGAYAVTVAAVASERSRCSAFTVGGLSCDPRACGRTVGRRVLAADADARCVLVFPDGITGDCTALADGITAELSRDVVVAGGTAADLARFTATYQYGADGPIRDGVSVAVFGGDVTAEIAVSHGCLPIGRTRTVTRSVGGLLYEIDYRPAWSVFKEYLDGDPDMLVAADSVHLSFGAPLPVAEVGPYGGYVLRTPLGLDQRSGALFFPGALGEGVALQLMRRDPDRIRQSAAASAYQLASRRPHASPFLVLQFECAWRGRLTFGDHAPQTVRPLQEVLGPKLPWAGFLTYGELAPIRHGLFFHNYTIVLCGLYEGGR